MHITLSANTAWYIWNFRLRLIRELKSDGHHITVIAPEDHTLERFKLEGIDFISLPLAAKSRNPLTDLITYRRYRSIYRSLRPDVCLHWTIKPNLYGSMAASALKIPVINNVSGAGTAFSGRGLMFHLVRILHRLAFSKVSTVFFQNKDDKALFESLKLVDSRRSALLPGSGVDIDSFPELPLPEDPFTFLFVGRMLKQKGVEILLEAMRLIHKDFPLVRLILLGGHDPDDSLMADQKLLKKAIHDGIAEFPGMVDDVRPWIKSAHCVVLPSWYREGVPRSLLEAAASGRPLIAADSTGTREPVEDSINGYLCAPRSVEDLADKMKIMIQSPKSRLSEMAHASRVMAVQRFDEQIVINAYRQALSAFCRQ